MLDPLLLPFVQANDPAGAERELDDLVERHVLPLANAIVTRKLRSSGTDGSGRFEIQDRDDVVGDAVMTLVERLWRLRAGSESEPIANFEGYAATVVYSACAHQIRRRHPQRARLKNRLRYVFSTDRRLALWTSGDELVCGRAEWRGRPVDRSAEQTLRRQNVEDDWVSIDRGPLARAVVDLVDRCGGPTDFEAFVAIGAARVVEPRETADATLVARSLEPAQDHALDQRRFLEQVWDEIRQLPVRQRIALLLNLRDPKGSGILWLLPIAGVATIRQIARILEIQDDEFARLWRELPMDDAAIGGRLGCTRQQVINLRVSARKRLINRLGRLFDPLAPSEERRGNLVPFSTSMKGSA
jgi:RNA polymerase sigma factor (sigma-70 family)